MSYSIYKQPGCDNWYAKIYVPGQKKPVRKSTKTSDKELADAIALDWAAKLQRIAGSADGRVALSGNVAEGRTVDALLKADKQEAQARGVEAGTLRGLDYAHAAIRAWFKEDTAPGRITYENVTEYVASRRESGIRGQSIVRELQCLKRITRAARRRGWILEEPKDWPRVKKDPKDLKRAGKFVQPEVLRLWIAQLPIDAQEAAIILATTGLRREELERLRYDDIQERGGQYLIVIRDEATKSTAHDPVPLDPTTFAVFRARAERIGGELVFGKTNFNRTFRRVAEKVCGKNIHPRDLRHTLGTLLAQKDPVAAMRLFGHRDLKTTEIYTSTTIERSTTAITQAATQLALGPKK